MRRVFVLIISQRLVLESLALGLIAFLLRVINLEGWPRWYSDEGTNGYTGVNMFNGIWGSHVWGPNFFPPLFPAVCGLMSTLMEPSLFAIRLPAAVTGALSIVLLYLIVNKLYNRSIAIVASLLLIVASLYINRLALMDNFSVFFILLTVFFYIKLRDEEKQRWSYLMGISAGLAFLSKFTGIAASIFIVFQSLMDKRFKHVWPGLVAALGVALVYPIIGLIVNWDYFLADTFFQASRPLQFDQLSWVLLMGHPTDQLYKGFFFFNLWAPLGFLSTFYLLARNKAGDRLLSVLVGSIFITYFLAGQIWWVFLLALYPAYCVAITVVLNDIVRGEGNYRFLAIFTILLLVPLSNCRLLYPNFEARAIIIIFLLIVAGIFLTLAIQTRFRYLSRALLVIPLTVMIIAGALSELTPLIGNTNEANPTIHTSADQKTVVDWLNTHTEEGDMVTAPGPIVYLLDKAIGVDYAEVALYESGEAYHIYPLSIIPRFNIDAKVSNFRYFVADTPMESLGPLSKIAWEVMTTWELSFQFGDFRVYVNPGEDVLAVAEKWQVVSPLARGTEDSGLDVVDNTFSLSLASTTPGERVDLAVVTRQQYSLPLEIVVNHRLPQLDTIDLHAYDFKIQYDLENFIIVHYLNAPNSFMEVGLMHGNSWNSKYYESKVAPIGNCEWRFVIDSAKCSFFENGQKICEFDNTLDMTYFKLGFSQVTEDTTLKSWIINAVEVNGEKIQ